MNITDQQIETLAQRSNQQCELCRSEDNLSAYLVSPKQGHDISDYVYACKQCRTQIDNPETLDVNHWHCLNDSIWSEVSAVKVLAWRILKHLQKDHGPQDLLDMIYLTDEELSWAKDGFSTGHSMAEMTREKHATATAMSNDGDDVFLSKT
jgi:PhnA Zinc-Ribbon.